MSGRPAQSARSAQRVVEILLVEDNPGDELLTRLALEEARVPHRLRVARDGAEALDLLQRGEYRPDLVLLDLNMPRTDGRAVLAALKSDVALRSIPVTVLTTSSSDADVDGAYDHHASGYIVKPTTFDELVEAIRGLDRYWFGLVRLPDGRNAGRHDRRRDGGPA